MPEEFTSTENKWLKTAEDTFNSSSDYWDTNFRRKWEDSLRHWQSRHRSGSKYYKESFKHRSKLFRAKTRSAVRGNEAAVMAAFFSNSDVVAIDPVNPEDPIQVASAQIHKELLNVRFTRHIKWFKLAIAAAQDAMVIGVCVSLQEWDVEKDCPKITLLPIEHVRFSPNADWIDPVNKSPYLIVLRPMYVMDVKEKMAMGEWKKLDDDTISKARKHKNDPTAQVRDQEREDSDGIEVNDLSDFDVVWVHQNFVRQGSKDVVYFTLSTEAMLSEPVPIEDMYFHGERPIVIGEAVIESHRSMPDSYVSMAAPVQQEINEIANQRADNVKLVLNKRFKVRRGAQVDVKSLLRNVPGGVTMVNDPNTDVVSEEFNDITGSSYMEQDRLNVDFDELMGAFSASTIQTNRKMNETVGGMSMLQGTSHTMTEYLLRTLAETWFEPVIRQVVKLEQYYETDENLLHIIGEKLKLFVKYGIDRITDYMINQELSVTVNMGTGAADPTQRLNRLLTALKYVSEIFAQPIPGVKMDEVIKEIFGIVGYRDGKRFVDFQGEGPVIEQLKGIIQQLQQQIAEQEAALKNKDADRQAKLIQTKMKEDAETERTDRELSTEVLTTELKVRGGLAEKEMELEARENGQTTSD